MKLEDAIKTRTSQHYLVDPAPSDEEFLDILRWAALAPDHGRLHPWRWILIRGTGRAALGLSFAAGCESSKASRAAAIPLRAPLLATLIFSPRLKHKVPCWEQLAATAGMANSLMLLLHDRGYGSIWRTGPYTESADVRVMLDLDHSELILGWFYIGTSDTNRTARERAPVPVASRVSKFRQAERLASVRASRVGIERHLTANRRLHTVA
ncbi:MAG: nitroreductase [Pseudonocardia sp.]|nr:nitroreductase [Pseudonocardia sp.]